MSWATTKLGDFSPLVYGKSLPKRSRVTDGHVDVFGSGGVDGKHDEALTNGPTIIVGRKGTVGKVYFSPTPCWPIDTTYFIEDEDLLSARFKYYALQALGLERLNYDSAVPGLKRDQAHSIQLRVPSADIQRHVATALGTLDDLIESNRRRIGILEEMARLLYREWFVHFRFPGHEDAQLVDSHFDPVPEGWEAMKLSELVTTQYGYTESASTEPVGPRYLRGMDMNKTSYIDWSTVPFCPISRLDHQKFAVQVGDVFVIRMADPGKVGICERTVDAVFASYLVRLRPSDDRITPYYLFFALSDEPYQAWVTGASTGATRKSVSAKVMTEPYVVVPSPTVLEQFDEAVRPMRSLMSNLLEQNAVLRETRDLLLPRLVSGELDVSELDLDLEAVGA